MVPCRVLPFETADGPLNMALDETLLDSVASGGSAVLRTYGWSEPTLSLGYFQPIARAESEPRWRDVPIVRRPTGGGALWHDAEVTYCIVLPASHPLARRSTDLYAAVHSAIAALLHEAGLTAARRGEGRARSDASKPFLCFLDSDAEDVVSGSIKLVGSAQRRRAGAVLQHGSLLLAQSRQTPELKGVADLSGLAADAIAWSHRLLNALPTALGLESAAGTFSGEERGRALSLAVEVYRNQAWTRKR
jgi:lipoate-protein ligase A